MLSAGFAQVFNESTNKYEEVLLSTKASEIIFNDGQTLQYKLESGQLNGKDGRDGTDGINGRNGEDGADGADGADGEDGVTTTITVPGCTDWVDCGSCTLDNGGTIIADKTGIGAQFVKVKINNVQFYGYVMKLSNGAWAGSFACFSIGDKYTVWDACRDGTKIQYWQTYPVQETEKSNNLKYYDNIYNGDLTTTNTSAIKAFAKAMIAKIPAYYGAWASFTGAGGAKWLGFWMSISDSLGGGIFFTYYNNKFECGVIWASTTGSGGYDSLIGGSTPSVDTSQFVTSSQLTSKVNEMYNVIKTYCDQHYVQNTGYAGGQSSSNNTANTNSMLSYVAYLINKAGFLTQSAADNRYVQNNGYNGGQTSAKNTSNTNGMLSYVAYYIQMALNQQSGFLTQSAADNRYVRNNGFTMTQSKNLDSSTTNGILKYVAYWIFNH